MVLKYKFNLKDITLEDFKVYFLSMFKSIIPKKKIKNLYDLESFIQKKSSFNEIMKFIDTLKSKESASEAPSDKKAPFNPKTHIKRNKTSITLPTLKINLQKESKDEIKAKLDACKLFIQTTESALKSI